MIPCEILKQKRFLNRFCKVNVSDGVHLQKNFRSQVFNFTKNILNLVVPPAIWEIFRIAFLWMSAANYCHYYVIWHGLFYTRVLICIYFSGNTGRSLLSVCLITFHLLFPILIIYGFQVMLYNYLQAFLLKNCNCFFIFCVFKYG